MPEFQRFPAVAGDAAGTAEQAQHAGGDDLIGGVVLGDQDAAAAGNGAGRDGLRCRPACRRAAHRKPELAAFAKRAGDPDFAAEQADDLLADGQPEAAAAIAACRRGIRLGEGVEDRRQGVPGNADPAVLNGKPDEAAVAAFFDFQDDAAGFGKLDGIAQQVDQYLPDAAGIAVQPRRQCGVEMAAQVQALAVGLVAEQGQGGVDDFLQVEVAVVHFEAPGFEAGEIQDVVDQFQQVLRGVPGQSEQFALGRFQPTLLEHVEGADDAVQRGPDFVADGRGKIRLQPGKAERAVARGAQFEFALLERRHHAVEGLGHFGNVARAGRLGAQAGFAAFGAGHVAGELGERAGHPPGQAAEHEDHEGGERNTGAEIDHEDLGDQLLQRVLALPDQRVTEQDVVAFGGFELGLRVGGRPDRGDEAPAFAVLGFQIRLPGFAQLGARAEIGCGSMFEQCPAIGVKDLDTPDVGKGGDGRYCFGNVFGRSEGERQAALGSQSAHDAQAVVEFGSVQLAAALPGGQRSGQQRDAHRAGDGEEHQLLPEGGLPEPLRECR